MRIVKPTGSLSERPTRVCRSLRVPELTGTPRADDAQPSWHHEVVRRHFCPLDQASSHLDSVPEPWSVPLDVRLNGTVIEDRLTSGRGSGARQTAPSYARTAIIRQRYAQRYEWEIIPAAEVNPPDVVVCSAIAAPPATRAGLK
jgi:hypothetical protein